MKKRAVLIALVTVFFIGMAAGAGLKIRRNNEIELSEKNCEYLHNEYCEADEKYEKLKSIRNVVREKLPGSLYDCYRMSSYDKEYILRKLKEYDEIAADYTTVILFNQSAYNQIIPRIDNEVAKAKEEADKQYSYYNNSLDRLNELRGK